MNICSNIFLHNMCLGGDSSLFREKWASLGIKTKASCRTEASQGVFIPSPSVSLTAENSRKWPVSTETVSWTALQIWFLCCLFYFLAVWTGANASNFLNLCPGNCWLCLLPMFVKCWWWCLPGLSPDLNYKVGKIHQCGLRSIHTQITDGARQWNAFWFLKKVEHRNR